MIISTIVMGVITLALLYIAYRKGTHFTVLKSGLKMLLQLSPLLIIAFIMAEAISGVVPAAASARWIGAESGFRGLFIGTAAGSLTPCCPSVDVVMTSAFLKVGASLGTAVAFLSGSLLLTVTRIPVELGIVKWRFTLIRLACTFFIPVVAGLIVNILFSNLHLGI